jgi:hydroxymethylglutaryl-CoA reductase
MPIARATSTAIEFFLALEGKGLAGQPLTLDISVYVTDALGMNRLTRNIEARSGRFINISASGQTLVAPFERMITKMSRTKKVRVAIQRRVES